MYNNHRSNFVIIGSGNEWGESEKWDDGKEGYNVDLMWKETFLNLPWLQGLKFRLRKIKADQRRCWFRLEWNRAAGDIWLDLQKGSQTFSLNSQEHAPKKRVWNKRTLERFESSPGSNEIIESSSNEDEWVLGEPSWEPLSNVPGCKLRCAKRITSSVEKKKDGRMNQACKLKCKEKVSRTLLRYFFWTI